VPVVLESLSKSHDRAGFDCGTPELNEYFKKFALQDTRKNLSWIFVLVEDTQPSQVIGYFSLSQYAVKPNGLPEHLKKKLPPSREVPCTLLGRLAVNLKYKGQGFGYELLFFAMKYAVKASENIASFALIVDAKDHIAKSFYVKYGFLEFTDNPMRLMIPMQAVNRLMPL